MFEIQRTKYYSIVQLIFEIEANDVGDAIKITEGLTLSEKIGNLTELEHIVVKEK